MYSSRYLILNRGDYLRNRVKEIGKMNLIGVRVTAIRKDIGMSQKELLLWLQEYGLKISATSLSRIEGQHRQAFDFEVLAFAEVLNVSIKTLLGLCV